MTWYKSTISRYKYKVGMEIKNPGSFLGEPETINHKKMRSYYFWVSVLLVVDLLSLVQSLVHFLPSLVQVLSSLPPPQRFMVHLSSLQLPVQVHPLPLQPPSPANAGCAINPVIPTRANVNRSFFIMEMC